MKLARIAAIGGALTTVAAGLTLAASPAYAIAGGDACGTANHNQTVTEGGKTYQCLPGSHSSPQWRWMLQPTPIVTTTAPAPKPGVTVTQTCITLADISHTRINGGVTETCNNVNGVAKWGKGNVNVDQTCATTADLNRARISGGVNETCTNDSGVIGWSKTATNVTQACTVAAQVGRTRIRDGLTETCTNTNGKIGWGKGNSTVTQTCLADVDLTNTVIYGTVNVTCANIDNTIGWVPPVGQSCPAGLANCATQPNPVLYAPCPVRGEPIKLDGRKCVCGQKKPADNTPVVETAPFVVVPVEEAVVPVAAVTALPVTGSDLPLQIAVGFGLVAAGVSVFILVRRQRRIRFTA